jgi:hypothetical protein
MVIKIVRLCCSLLLCWVFFFLSRSGSVSSGKAAGRKRRGEQYASAGAAMGEKQLGLGILSALGHRLTKPKSIRETEFETYETAKYAKK